MKKIWKLRKIWLFLLLFIVSCFLYFKVVPFGNISYERHWPDNLKSGKGFIYNFSPVERMDLDSSEYPRVIGDPVYFSLFTPRPFNEVEMEIRYRDNLDYRTPVVEAGVLVDKIVWRYDLKPIENKLLDQFILNWSVIEEGDSLFLQKEKNYDSIAEFKNDFENKDLKNCSDEINICLALYNYSLDFDYRLPSNKTIRPIDLENPLRGVHQFFVYTRDGNLSLDIELVDLNQDKELDPISIILYRNNEIISEQHSLDDGLNQTSGVLEEKFFSIREENLAEGAYKVEVKVSNDIVIRKIASSSDKISFINKIWPVSTYGNLDIYTDTNYIQVKSMSPGSRQIINFARQNFEITETYKQFYFYPVLPQIVNKIKIGKDDVVLENNSVFSWSVDSLFNPSIKKIDRYVKLDGRTKYILAKYQAPIEKDGWKVAKVKLNLEAAYREDGKYSFIISIPGLKTEDETGKYLEISEIKMKLTGRTLWQKISSLF